MPAPAASPPNFAILEVLRALRGRIRRYVAWEGAALVAVVLGLAFWLSLAVDYLFEIPGSARGVLLALAVAAVGAALARYIVLRLTREFRDAALALVLERRFPQLNDRLITAVESAEAGDAPSSLTAALLRQTADEAAAVSQTLPLKEVFDLRPLVRAAGLALGLALSIAAFGFASGEVFSTWFRRNVLLADEYYRRDTDISVAVLAEPGERVVEFRDRVYKHPRGGDLVLLATVVPGMVVPESVKLKYRNVEQFGGGSDSMTKIGQRAFRQRLPGLHDSIRLWLSGGDYATRDAYFVQIVDPPQIDKIVLQCMYPAYTGLNALDEYSGLPARQSVAVLGTQVSLPAGTDLVLHAATNKPLVSARIQTDLWEIRATRETTTLTFAAAGDAPPQPVSLPTDAPLLATDGRGFRLPLLLMHARGAATHEQGEGLPALPLRLPAESTLRMILHDEDDVVSSDPVRLTISAIADEPPRIETRLKGIGASVTRQATIPVVGEIQDATDGTIRYGVTDDYGIVDAGFEYRVASAAPSSSGEPADVAPAGEPAWRRAHFASQPEGRTQFPVEERFALRPLDLTVGSRLMLRVAAADGDNLTGPHVATGTTFTFQVVTDDELLSQIAIKELNIRRRFEQILEEVQNTRKDLLLARTRLEESRAAAGSAERSTNDAERQRQASSALSAGVTSVERAIAGVRKNANETQSIEEEFRDIREELENNAIADARPMLERLENGIIRPLHSINTVDYNAVDDALVALLPALEQQPVALSSFGQPVEQLNVTIEHLEAVLAQMLRLETVNEAMQMLRDIIKAQEELQERTRQKRKKNLIEGLQ